MRVPSVQPANVEPARVIEVLGAVKVSPMVTVPALTGTEPDPPFAAKVTVYVSATQRA